MEMELNSKGIFCHFHNVRVDCTGTDLFSGAKILNYADVRQEL